MFFYIDDLDPHIPIPLSAKAKILIEKPKIWISTAARTFLERLPPPPLRGVPPAMPG